MQTTEMSKIIIKNTLMEKIKVKKTVLDSLQKMITQETFKPLTDERKSFLEGAKEDASKMQKEIFDLEKELKNLD